MAKLKVFLSSTFDPWFNLATEDWIFRDMDPDTHVLFLWRNDETVVIGRFQNPWTECDLKKMKRDGIKLARRQSGGGAVFHDLGNTNFTFMSGKHLYEKKNNLGIITNALSKFGIEATPSGRNDILVDGRKFSGSAFKENRDRAFHHGTLLINADLEKLVNYLSPSKKKLISKGIASIRSRVVNLSEFDANLTHENLSHEIIKEFFKSYGSECSVEQLDHNKLKSEKKLADYYHKLKSKQWCLGETPKFTYEFEHRFDWGQIEVHLNSHKALITAIKIYSDSLHPEMIEQLEKELIGAEYNDKGAQKAIAKVKSDLPMIVDYLNEFERWFIEKIE